MSIHEDMSIRNEITRLRMLRDFNQRDVTRRPRTLEKYGALESTKQDIARQTAEIERLEQLLHA